MPDKRFIAVLLLCALSGASCAVRTVRWSGECFNVQARLTESWGALQEARSSPEGCGPARNGMDRCESLRAEVERLSYECPNHVPTLMASAILAYDAKEFVKAQQLLDTLFSIQKVYPEAAVLRARIALEEGNVPFALRFLAQQIRVSPDHAGLREAYASALYMSGRGEEAKAQLTIAAKLGAPIWRVAYHQGLIEEAAGNAQEAQRYYEQALKERPGWKPAESRLNGLHALSPDGRAGIQR